MRKIFNLILVATIFMMALATVNPVMASPAFVETNPPPAFLVKNMVATGTSNSSWTWDIAKVGSTSSLTLSPGQTAVVNYDVTVTGVPVAGGWTVSGSYLVWNQLPQTVVVTSNLVNVGGTLVTPVCAPLDSYPTLPSGYSVTCTFSASGTGAAPASVSAAVVTDIPQTFNTSADVSYSAGGVTGQCINVTDSLKGALGEVCGTTNPTVKTFHYSYTVGPYNTCGLYKVDNTATIVENGKTAKWTVNVDVPCGGGCTLTIGYWKTHSSFGPAPYDPAWANVGESTTFFLSGQTWMGVFNTAPAGNAYYILAHQYMGAKLNVLDGASAPANVTAALAAAEALFNTYTPAQVTKDNKAQFVALAATLDSYNNGLIGPGHCSE